MKPDRQRKKHCRGGIIGEAGRMEDERIIELYYSRDEEAIRETEAKYKQTLFRTAVHVLGNPEDAEDVVNDVLLKTWNSIPPARPQVLSAWLRKLTRRTAIDVYRKESRIKRGGSEYDLALSEIGEMASGTDGPEELLGAKELARIINAWLRTISPEKRRIFLLRYFDSESIRDIARATGKTESAVRVTLLRLRDSLKEHLNEEGYRI